MSPKDRTRSFRRIRQIGMVGAVVFALLLFQVLTGGLFLRPINLTNFPFQNAYLMILAPGMVLVMITGRLDLSVGSVVALVGTVFAVMVVDWDAAPVLAAVTALLLGTAIGGFHGYLIAYLRMPMFVVTLAGMLIWRGLTLVILRGETKAPLGPAVTAGSGLPWLLFLLLLVGGLYTFLAGGTTFGRRLYAFGGNPETARLSGVPTRRVLFLVYGNNGFLAAVAGLVVALRLNAATPKAGTFFELDVITACLIGGAGMVGGVGTVGGAFFGALLIGVLNNGMSLLGVGGQEMIKASIMLAAGVFHAYSRRRAGTLEAVG